MLSSAMERSGTEDDDESGPEGGGAPSSAAGFRARSATSATLTALLSQALGSGDPGPAQRGPPGDGPAGGGRHGQVAPGPRRRAGRGRRRGRRGGGRGRAAGRTGPRAHGPHRPARREASHPRHAPGSVDTRGPRRDGPGGRVVARFLLPGEDGRGREGHGRQARSPA
ncbi:hypothetical protein THAOC_32215 [Thalassiosira oceanica]|uniref:Uncharacterized protein n=1 Tax=Thalassiosira oceanica TaxID=159749 RepID=K0R9N5_THAOC|nr:hypothetical protein THAOC_32215 [Thalassiosira oceanica]|eukprot:EJK48949.1 hypothetical protein THAOC_32215 [Thalassiosira oceanica]